MLMLRRHQSQEFVTIVTLTVLVVVGVVTVALACFLYRRWRMLRRRHVLLHGSVLDFDSEADEAGADGDSGTYAGPGGDALVDAGRRAGASGWRLRRFGKYARLTEGTASLPAACRKGIDTLAASGDGGASRQGTHPESEAGASRLAPALPGIDDAPSAAPQRQAQQQLDRQAVAGFDTFSSDLHRFSVAKPRGWQLETAASTESVVVRFATPRRAPVYQRFTVTWEDVSWAATRPEKFARSLAAELRRDLPGASVERVAPYTGVAARTSPSGAWLVEYTVQQSASPHSRGPPATAAPAPGPDPTAGAGAGAGLRLLTVILMAGRGRARASRAQSWARAFSLSFATDAPAFKGSEQLMSALIDSFVVEDAAHHLDAEAWIEGGTSSLADTPPESPCVDSGYLPTAFAEQSGHSAPGPARGTTPAELAAAAAAKARGMAASAGARATSAAVAIPVRRAQREGSAASGFGGGRRQSSTDDAAGSWAAAAVSMPPMVRGGVFGRADDASGSTAAQRALPLSRRPAHAQPAPLALPRLERTELGKAGMSVSLPASWTASSAVSPTASAASAGPRVDLTLQAPMSSAHWGGCSVRLVCVDLTPLAVRVDGTRALADQWAAHFEQQVAAGQTAGPSAMAVAERSRVSTDTTRFSLRPGDGSSTAVALAVVGLHYRADSVFGYLLTASGPGGAEAALRLLADAVGGSMSDCALAT